MLVVMRQTATPQEIEGVVRAIEARGFRAHPIPGAQRTAIGVTGNKGAIDAPVFEPARRSRGDRGSIFVYHYGLDTLSTNKQLGQQKMASLVDVLWLMYEKLGSINCVYVRTFFDSKSGEIIDYLRDYPDPELFSKLKKNDPPHSSKYEEVMP